MPLSREVEVSMPEWLLIIDTLKRRREFCPMDLIVTVTHEGYPDLWEFAEIEFASPSWQPGDERHPVPPALREIIENTMRGREEDREAIRVAISESLQGVRRAA